MYRAYKEVFPKLHAVNVTALVIEGSTTAYESSFSRVLTPLHPTMQHNKKRNLVILAHEQSITKGIDMDEKQKTSALKWSFCGHFARIAFFFDQCSPNSCWIF